jgi:hypothetical protein
MENGYKILSSDVVVSYCGIYPLMLPIIYSITLLIVVGGFSTFVFATQHSKVLRIREENVEFKKRVNEFHMYSKLKLKDLVDKSNDKFAKVATSYDQLNNEIASYKKVNARYSKEKQNDLRELSQQTAKESDILRDMINSQDIYIDRQKKKVIDDTYASIRNAFHNKSNLDFVRDELGYETSDGKYYAKDFELVDNSGVSVLKLRKKMNDLKSQINSDLDVKFSRNVNTLRGLNSKQQDLVLGVNDLIFEQSGRVNPDLQLQDEKVAMIAKIASATGDINTEYASTFARVGTYLLDERSNVVSLINTENVDKLRGYREKLLEDSQESARDISEKNAQLSNNVALFQNEWTNRFQQTNNAFASQLHTLEGSYEQKKREIDETTKSIQNLQKSVNDQYLPISQFSNTVANSTRVHQHLAERITNQERVVHAPNYKIASTTYVPSSLQAPDHMTDLSSRIDQLDFNVNKLILPYTQNGKYDGDLHINNNQQIEFTDAISMKYNDVNNAVDVIGNVNINANLFVLRDGNPLWVKKSTVENAVNAIDASYANIPMKSYAETRIASKANRNHTHDDVYFSRLNMVSLNDRFAQAYSNDRIVDNIINQSIPPNRIKSLNFSSIDFTGASSSTVELRDLQGANILLSSVPNLPASNIMFASQSVNFTNVNTPADSLKISDFNTPASGPINVTLQDIKIDPDSIPPSAIKTFPVVNYNILPLSLKEGSEKVTFQMKQNSVIRNNLVNWSDPVPTMNVSNMFSGNPLLKIGDTAFSLAI